MSFLATISRDRLWDAFRKLISIETFPLRFLGTYEYTISATDGTTVDASPNDTSLGLPPVNKAELRADSIATQEPTVGNLCHIIFVNGDQSKYKCTWCQPGPQSAAIAGGSSGVARNGDHVKVTLSALEIAQIIAPAGSVGGPCSGGPIDITGTITDSSTKVTCG